MTETGQRYIITEDALSQYDEATRLYAKNPSMALGRIMVEARARLLENPISNKSSLESIHESN